MDTKIFIFLLILILSVETLANSCSCKKKCTCDRNPPKPGNPCKGIQCCGNETCVLVSQTCSDPPCKSTPQCTSHNPCPVPCPKDEVCYPVQVECVTTPCYPIPECHNPCDNVRCNEGEKCVPQSYDCGSGNYCPPRGVCLCA